MRINRTMEQHVDNAGWATFGTVVGLFTAAHELAQFATAMFTLISGIVVAHFLKRYLNYRFPAKTPTGKPDTE